MLFIGRDSYNPDKYYLLVYEGNGTCYSVAGAFILKDLLNGKKCLSAACKGRQVTIIKEYTKRR